MKQKNVWRWWAKALGEKPSKCDRESDKIALIRTFIFATYLITNCFIVAGVIRQWNKESVINIEVIIDEGDVPSVIHSSEKERIIKANSRRFPND
jgi:hypothetical protein